MKKLMLFLAVLVAAFSIGAHAQGNIGIANSEITSTVANLPPAASCKTDSTACVRIVTDGTSATDCTVGGASTRAHCSSNGSVWASLGGGAGGGITNSAGTNVVPKSDGTNIVASNLSDSGTAVQSKVGFNYFADTGAADAYVITPSPCPAAYAAGQSYTIKAANANTLTNPTLNVCGLGVKTIFKNGSAGAMVANDIKANSIFHVTYDGSAFQFTDNPSNPCPGPPTANTQVQFDNNGACIGIVGSSADNLTDVTSANSNMIGLNRTYGVGSLANAMHLFDCTIDYTGTIKENTEACFYGSLIFDGAVAGAGGQHIGSAFFRVNNRGKAGIIDELDAVYGDMQNTAADVTTVTESTIYNSLTSTFQGGAGNVYSNHAGFRYRTASWTAPTVATIEQAFVAQMPTLANAQLITFYGLRTGGCAKANVYSAMCIDGGASYFKQGIDQTLTFDQTIASPLTTGGILTSPESAGIHQSNFVGTNIIAANQQGLLTGQTGNTGATMIGDDQVVDNGGNSTPSLDVVYRAQLKNSGGGVVTDGTNFLAITPQNSSTYTDTTGFKCNDLTAATQTNTPQCFKQLGTSIINTYAGPSFLNGNKAFVNSSEFTTSGSGTSLEAITGLTFTLPLNTAENVSFSCNLVYHQNAGTAAVAFGVKNSVSPTNVSASAEIYTSTTAFTAGNLQTLSSTTATAVVSATPSVITTNWNVNMRGFIENPSGAANTFTILVSTATAGDTVTIKRGSYCVLGG